MTVAGLNVMSILSEQLKLKQLELDTLLDITIAINSNEPAAVLYEIFSNTIIRQLHVERFMLLAFDMEWSVAA